MAAKRLGRFAIHQPVACLLSSVALLPLCWSSSALAQTASSVAISLPSGQSTSVDGATIEEIVVTAQRRSENIQKVPLSVAAVSAENLAAANIDGLEGLSTLVAGYQGPGDSGIRPVHIRGIGAQGATAGTESPIAMYIDNVYIAIVNPALQGLNNIERVEVLKGPQGTLFGRNSTGGVISITTPTPGDKFKLKAEIGYANFDTLSGSGYISGPISKNISADFSIQASHQGDGWGVNLNDGKDVHRFDRTISMRSKWIARISESTRLILSGDYERTFWTGGSAIRMPTGDISAFGIVGRARNWDVDVDSISTDLFKGYGGSARIETDLGSLKLTSTTAYREARANSPATDFDVTPVPAIVVGNASQDKQITQEFQVTSGNGGRLDWQVGLFYINLKDSAQAYPRYGAALAALVPFASTLTQSEQETNSVSAYAQGTYKLTDTTRLTLGGRYTWEKKTYNANLTATLRDGTVLPGSLVGSPAQVDRRTDKVFTWRAALDQDLSQNVLAYASASRGYKSGGFNLYVIGNPGFQPETLDAFEAGLKSTLFDRKLRLNASMFYYDYRNIQVTAYTPLGQQLYNGASARVYGADIDFEARPTSRLTIGGAISFLNSRFKDFPNAIIATPIPTGGFALASGSAKGNDLPLAAKLSTSLQATYTLPTEIGQWQLSGTWSYNDGYYTEADNRLRQPSYNLFNSSLLYTTPNDRYYIRAWISNITNQKVASFLLTSQLAAGVILDAPRTYGVTLGAKL